jgi:hypothetical protein
MGRWHVTSQTLCPIAELVSRGFVRAEDDYDTISIFITDTGREYAIEQDWLDSTSDTVYEPWTRSAAGTKASNYITHRP